MNFTIQASRDECRLILKFRGILDFSVREHFLLTLNKYKNEHRLLIIDLKEVTQIDSAGVGMLALLAKRSQVVSGVTDVVIVNPRGQVRDSLRQCNFSALVPVSDSDLAYSSFTNIPH